MAGCNDGVGRMGRRAGLVAASFVAALMAGSGAAAAQEGPGGLISPQRDCQTILTCNFKRGGSFRGCLSSYSCRVCRTVPARCSVGSRRGVCHQVRCSWGA